MYRYSRVRKVAKGDNQRFSFLNFYKFANTQAWLFFLCWRKGRYFTCESWFGILKKLKPSTEAFRLLHQTHIQNFSVNLLNLFHSMRCSSCSGLEREEEAMSILIQHWCELALLPGEGFLIVLCFPKAADIKCQRRQRKKGFASQQRREKGERGIISSARNVTATISINISIKSDRS